MVQGVPTRRDAVRGTDHLHQFGELGPVPRARGGDHVLLQHDAAEVVHAHVQGHLADVLARGQPRRLQVRHVVEEQPGHRDEAQVLQVGRLRASLQMVVLRLVRPRDERPETAGTVLHVADHPQVLDALGGGLAGTHHHGRGRLDAQPVRGLHHLEPTLPGLLERRDRGPRTGRQHLGAGAGDGVEPGRLDAAHGLLDGHPGHTRHVHDLAGSDGVDHEVGVRLLDRREHRLVVLDAVLRVVPALQHDLGGAQLDRFAAPAQDLLQRMRPALGVPRRPVERAELARGHAHVGVVDVPVDDVRDDVVRVPPTAYRVGRLTERVQRRVQVQQQRLLGGDAPAVRATPENVGDLPGVIHRASVRGAGRRPTA